MELRNLYVAINLVDNLTAPLRQASRAVDAFKANLASAQKPAADLESGIRRYAARIRDAMRGASQAIQQHRETILALGAALSGIGYSGYRFFSSATKEYANLQDAMRVFRRYAGENADEILREMEKAAAGTISYADMVLNANRAMVMGIDPEYLPEMMRIARAAARAMGTDVSYMFESIAVGTARQSKLILDNLGIIINAEEAYEKYAKQLGKTANQLTEAEKRQAFLNAVMESGRKLADQVDMSQESLNEELARAKVAWEEFRVELVEGALPVIRVFVDNLERFTAWLRDLPAPVKAVGGTIGVLATAISAVLGPLLLQIAAAKYLGFSFTALIRPITAVIAALKGLAAAAVAALAPLAPFIAIALAVAAVILLLQDVLVKGWEKSYLGQFVSWLLEKLPFLKPVAEAVATAIDWLKRGFEWLAGVIKSFIDWIWQAIGSLGPLKYILFGSAGALLYLAQNFDKLKDIAGSALKALRTIWDHTIGAIITKINEFIAMIQAVILLLQDVLVKGWEKSYLGRFVAWLADGLKYIADVITGTIKAIWEFISGNPIVKWLLAWVRLTISTFRSLVGAVGSALAAVINAVKGFLEHPVVKAITDWITGFIKAITENPVIRWVIEQTTGVKAETVPTVAPEKVMPSPTRLVQSTATYQTTTINSPRIENKTVQVPKIEIKIEGVRDPEKVAELVEKRLDRKFASAGII